MAFSICRSIGVCINRRLTLGKAIFVFAVAIPIFNEYIAYMVQSWLWSDMELPGNGGEEDHMRLLFVADPQLVGIQDEPAILGYITRWDCDRYLQKTFSLAYNFVKPDAVVFMGDLLDEGSKAQESEYLTYIHRFQSVFSVTEDVQNVFVSGDNDVGGEGIDFKEDWKINRFDKYFKSEKSVQTSNFIDFLKLNYDFGDILDKSRKQRMEDSAARCRSPIRIVLNHMGLLNRFKNSFQAVVDITKPSVVFTAHTHMARLYSCIDCRDPHDPSLKNMDNVHWRGGIQDMRDYTVYKLYVNDHSTLHEVVVPTCSYRMGVPDMGYGAAIISRDGNMVYTILWSPSRYRQLFFYAYCLVVLVSVLTVRTVISFLTSKTSHKPYRPKIVV